MKRFGQIVMLLFLWLLTACGTTESEKLPVYQGIEDLKGKKVGNSYRRFSGGLCRENVSRSRGVEN